MCNQARSGFRLGETIRTEKRHWGRGGSAGHTRDERDTRAHTGTRTGTVPPPVFLIHECVPGSSPRAGPHACHSGMRVYVPLHVPLSCNSATLFHLTLLSRFCAPQSLAVSASLDSPRHTPGRVTSRVRGVRSEMRGRARGRSRGRAAHAHTHTQRSTGHASSRTSSSHHACVRETHSSNCNPIASPLVEKRPRSRGEPSPARPRAHHGALLTPRWHAKKATAIAT